MSIYVKVISASYDVTGNLNKSLEGTSLKLRDLAFDSLLYLTEV